MASISVRFRKSFDADGDTIVHCIATHPKLKRPVKTSVRLGPKPSAGEIRSAERNAARIAKDTARREME